MQPYWFLSNPLQSEIAEWVGKDLRNTVYPTKYFMKQNWELVGIEVPILKDIQEGVDMMGYLDVVIRN